MGFSPPQQPDIQLDMLLMEDAVHPSEIAFRATYERGYRTWSALWDRAVADNTSNLPHECVNDVYLALPNHPYFPGSLTLDKSFSNTVTASGKTTWTTTQGLCDLLPFQEDVVFQVASNSATTIVFVSDSHPGIGAADYLNTKSNHVPVLTLAWAYILSARWAELIPGAHGPTYNNTDQLNGGSTSRGPEGNDAPIVVDVGDVDGDAARWWTAVLSTGAGWTASIRNNKGFPLYAPWAVRIQPHPTFLISANTRPPSRTTDFRPASFSTALHYLSEYCALHDVADQSQAALAAALLIPVAKLDGRSIKLPIPRLQPKSPNRQQRKQATSAWGGELRQLDRLLTLSCNSRAMKSLLNSVFFDPDVDCNVCGAWLQGSFAFLDSDKASDPHLRLRTLISRDPALGFLWLGAFITGADARCLREARAGWWKVDLSAAAWTGTHVSFIQGFVAKAASVPQQISRADECRLMYLSHERDHAIPPLFPFAPFGCTALEDTDLDVRRHVLCSASHGLVYGGFTWNCDSDGSLDEKGNEVLPATLRHKAGDSAQWNSAAVIYDDVDMEDDVSEMITRNVFTWLRGCDGFPVAEREIRKHEWIEDLESDDDSPIEGDVRPTAGGNIGGWLLGLSAKKAYSL
ncbi:immunoglobulin variable region used by the ITC63B heavy chain [Pochonia chlamydosporia 170]|uniref:Immunoglobulin variable region used by the ITC63B heavy chain n=1 Tax=Pochonia chlamydosporia 170 TaxID=1380566 RepID=A0A179G0N6_METCM|nr:immunoglobulin variable region used by the ITC63B heavy chain [Pochonia chlamydosporia 170]OAQ71020.1 immunoglobulin variable region used by the ITC63B heavy chain [Pochonia chlamydosporia 170]